MPADELAGLARFPTTTIANALESMGMAPDVGYTDARLSLATTGLPPFVGRAVTVQVSSRRPEGTPDSRVPTEAWWRHVAASAQPAIVVAEDLDDPVDGSMWGEVQGRLHQALGVAGIVTNGAVRDIDELSAIRFPVLAGRICVSHAYAHFVRLGGPVRVGGLTIDVGDLLHCDQHGVQRIPDGTDLAELLRVASTIEALERELFTATTTHGRDLDGFLETWRSVRSRWPRLESDTKDAI
jgi:regulator of RNase E activity RraA